MEEENKYHFAREIIFNLRSCHAITDKVYLHWIDKLIEDEKQAKNNESLHLVSHCDKDTKDLIEHTKRVVDLIKDKSGIAVKVLGDRVNKKLEQLDSCG